MVEDPCHQGRPLVGEERNCLGVRPKVDLPVGDNETVKPGTGGMSVNPYTWKNMNTTIRRLTMEGKLGLFYHPAENILTPLNYRPSQNTPDSHGEVEPAMVMPLQGFQDALAATRPGWCKGEFT